MRSDLQSDNCIISSNLCFSVYVFLKSSENKDTMMYTTKQALICPCLIVGENATLIVEEEMMCNNCLCHDVLKLGSKGCCFCFTSLPLCPALPIFSCFVCLLRWRMMEKYNIQEEDWCEAMKGCCFPCALTQQNIFLRELHHNRNKATFSFQSKHAFAPPTQRM